MRLVIYSSMPLDQLTKMASSDFSAIPNRHFAPFAIPLPQTSSDTQGKMVYISPVKDLRQLTLLWELPYDFAKVMETHAPELAAYVLGFEGEKSLLAELKKEGLAEKLKAAYSAFNTPSTPTYIFYISIDLTEEGVKKRDTVIERCFQTIEHFRTNDVPNYIYNEVQAMSLLEYEYQSREDVFSTVSKNARALLQEDLASYPAHTLLATDYNSAVIHNIFQNSRPPLAALLCSPILKKQASSRR